jgi:hypothetical protein
MSDMANPWLKGSHLNPAHATSPPLTSSSFALIRPHSPSFALIRPHSPSFTLISAPWTDWLDYLSFALSGLDSTGTIAAAVVYTLGDLYRPEAYLDYPIGGSEAVVNALIRGITKVI